MKSPASRHILIFTVLLFATANLYPGFAARQVCVNSGFRIDSAGLHLFLPSNFLESIRAERAQMAQMRSFHEGYRKASASGDHPRALAYSDSLLQVIRQNQIEGLAVAQAYRERAITLKQLKDDKQATAYYARAAKLRNAQMQRSQDEAVSEIQTTYELDRLALDQALNTARHHKTALFSALGLLLAILCAVAFFYISNRRTQQLQRELLRKIDQSRTSEAQKTAFINSMCHEIRTPLNCITGFSELLCSGEITPDIHAQYHDIIQQSRFQLRYAFNDMLEVAYLENLAEPLHRSYTDICAVCRSQVRLMQVKHAKPGVQYTADIPPYEVGIYTSEKYLTMLIFELLGNAHKFTPSGTIHLSCATMEGDRMVVTIEDTGCGIPLKEHERVFERFYKLDTFSQGNGLGLYLCKLIVRELRGEIHIDPTYTEGTRIVITLPRK